MNININVNDIPENKKANNINDLRKGTLNHAIESVKQKVNLSEEEKIALLKIYMEKDGEIVDLANELVNLTRQEIDNMLYTNDVKLSNDNIEDIEKDGHYYILIKYPAPRNEIKMVENYTGHKASDVFEEAKEANGLVSDKKILSILNEKKEAEIVDSGEKLGDNVTKDKNEAKLFNLRLLFDDPDTLEKEFLKVEERRKKLSATLKYMAMIKSPENPDKWKDDPKGLINSFGKDVVIAPDEELVMICPVGTSDVNEILAIVKENGVYKINTVYQTTYTPEQSNVEIGDEQQLEEEKKENPDFELSDGTSKKLIPNSKKKLNEEAA